MIGSTQELHYIQVNKAGDFQQVEKGMYTLQITMPKLDIKLHKGVSSDYAPDQSVMENIGCIHYKSC